MFKEYETTVADAPKGSIIETLNFGMRSGNYYKVSDTYVSGRVKAYRRFTGELTALYPTNKCRVIDPDSLDGGF